MKINKYGIVFTQIPCAIKTNFGSFNRMFVVDNERIMKFYKTTEKYGETNKDFFEAMYDSTWEYNEHAEELAWIFSDPLFQPAKFEFQDIILVSDDDKKIVVFDGFCKFETQLPLDFFLESEIVISLRDYKEGYNFKLQKLNMN